MVVTIREKRQARPRRPGGGTREQRAQEARETQHAIEKGVFARVIQDIEDRCLGHARRVLEKAGWPARSWQQDGLLVEDVGGRRLRSGADDDAVGRLQAAMDEAVREVQRMEGLEIGLLIKPFHGEDVGATMRRFAGPGGRIVEQAEADVLMRRARAARRAAPAAPAPVCELAALTAEAEGAETTAAW